MESYTLAPEWQHIYCGFRGFLGFHRTHNDSADGDDMVKADAQTQPAERLAFPLTEGVQMLNIGLSYGYELMKGGKLKTFKIGRRRMVTREALQEFIASQQAEAGRKRAA
jgi:excisionase family DNA binding protein